jgi:hypothetical protein
MAKWVILCCREKPLASNEPPVPQTDSGDQVENTKAIETTMVMAAETRGKRLFTKNTGPCEVVRRCIRTDSCPVLEG